MSKCRHCTAEFFISPDERRIRELVSPQALGRTFAIPPATACPSCRERQRLAFRNEWNFFKRTCAASGKSIISVFHPGSPLVVFDQEIWWSDEFDPLAYGREVDFSRPFFEQLEELWALVPRIAIQNAKSENSRYTNYSTENKDCYMAVGCGQSEGVLSSYRVFASRDVVDCYNVQGCELCQDCAHSTNLYRSRLSTHCHNSSDLILCEDCIGCAHCFGCINLRNASFHIFNEPVPEREYHAWMRTLAELPPRALEEFAALQRRHGVRALHHIGSEACSGDNLVRSKNCTGSFCLTDSRDSVECSFGESNSDCAHCNHFDNCELNYESGNLERNYRAAFNILVWYCSDVYYSANCFNSKNLFGCIGMKRHSHCILNREYAPEEYSRVMARLIEHMQETGEWGSFFPPRLAPFSYNETVAFERFPLPKDQALRLGYEWRDEGPPIEEGVPANAKRCAGCGRPWTVIPAEAELRAKIGAAPPDVCFRCRQRVLAAEAGRRPFVERACASCSTTLSSPESLIPVLCESCWHRDESVRTA